MRALRWLLVLFGLAVASLFVHRGIEQEVCRDCRATRTVVRWGVGLPFSRGWTVTESADRRDVEGHRHRWASWGGARRSLLWGSEWIICP